MSKLYGIAHYYHADSSNYDLPSALKNVQLLIRKYPNNAQPYILYAYIAHYSTLANEAERALDHARTLDPSNADVWIALADFEHGRAVEKSTEE
ncbi:MAG: hypothetical protein KJ626_00425, partial [Verrucomicrobia bacterium]|nr:hypothetical protein [Verrucomicrobiota bacterium]